ncbi:MFS transporter [Companilactobacillus nodensis]|uniref:Na+ xyloside symporter or related transporter n=1 Tax=Companilactobacillus nodensis DSM 19682 = JCM 14932 = NBRC 107160 TaxID=1423775 RepID=A0A0R1KJN5_9LACO|nr:MFS transporter [Companilactobacillus nodensis]KRK81113.1 Na+ xyloside symporter or related transporter [Companilactobacillus nodensis DSM 19682 = JCM 14932 = NBRC 107160]
MNKWVTSIPERLSYGLSDAADNLVFQMMTMYLLFFYTDVFGLTPNEVAILFVVARTADVFESLLIGVMIDHTHSKWGKSRPFFLWFSFPYVVFAILTFVTPGFLPHSGKLIWAYVTYLGLGFFYTAVNLPITSILPTMTENEKETTLLGVIRQFFGSSVQIIVATFTIPLVAFFGKGDQQKGFLLTIALFGLISLILILNTFFHVRERYTNNEINHQPLSEVWGMMKQNKPWMVISIVIFLYWMTTAIKNQTIIYYFKYVLKNEGMVSLANSFTLTALIGVVSIYYVSGRIGKKHTMLSGIAMAFVGQLIITFAAYTENMTVLFVGILVNSIGNGFIIGLVSIMIADTIRYGTAMGIQAEGVLASTDDFGVNLGLGLGGLVTAESLQLTGYVSNKAQSASTISAINLNFAIIPLILYAVMFLILLAYNESKIQSKIKDITN